METQIQEQLEQFKNEINLEFAKKLNEHQIAVSGLMTAQIQKMNSLTLRMIEENGLKLEQKILDSTQAQLKAEISRTNDLFRTEIALNNGIQAKASNDSILKQCHELLQTKLSDAQNQFSTDVHQVKSSIESHVNQKFELHNDSVDSKFAAHKNALNDDVSVKIDHIAKSLSENFESLLNAVFQEKFSHFLGVFSEFKSAIDEVVNNKLIDRTETLAKIKSFEDKIREDAMAVIKFNIEQARQQMEDAAKAEIKEGLKSINIDLI